MKKVLKIIGGIVGILVLALLGMGAFINFKARPTFDEVSIPDLQVNMSPENIELGKKLVVQNCAGCHKGHSQKFEGMKFEDLAAHETFGTIYTPNITQHKEEGIGNYTDGELYRLLRTGVKKNGELILPVMPSYVIADDQDIHAMIAFLKSGDPMVQPSDKKHPTYQPSFLAKALLSFVFKPQPYKESYPQKPALQDSVAYGRYMVNNIYGCYFCHSQGLDVWDMENPENTPNYLGGGTSFKMEEYESISPSLLMDGNSDVSNWTIEEFVDAVKYGQLPGKPTYRLPMHPYPMLDTAEVRAIYHYIKDYSKS